MVTDENICTNFDWIWNLRRRDCVFVSLYSGRHICVQVPGAPCEHLGGHRRASFAAILHDSSGGPAYITLSETGSLLSLEFAG